MLRDEQQRLKEKTEENQKAEEHNEKMLAQSRKSKAHEHMPTIMKDRKNSSRDGFMIDSAQKFNKVNPYQMNPPDKRLGTAPAPMNQFGRPRTAAMLLETAAGINRPNTGT